MENTNDKYVLDFQKARNWLLIMMVATLVSCGLFAAGFVFRVPFSASMPLDVLFAAGGMALYYGNEAYWLGGIIFAFFIVFMYLLFWVLSKRRRVLMVFALIFFIVDTVFLGAGFLGTISEAALWSVFLSIGLHGWILFCLIKGTIAWAKLRGVTYEQFIQDLIRLAKEARNQARS